MVNVQQTLKCDAYDSTCFYIWYGYPAIISQAAMCDHLIQEIPETRRPCVPPTFDSVPFPNFVCGMAQ